MSSRQLIPQSDQEQIAIRKERRAARAQRRKERQRARFLLWSTIGSTALLLGFMGFLFLQIQSRLVYNPAYPPINGETCDTVMHSTYHIHIHLTIYVYGKAVPIPQGIGIAADGSCYYWMHTHTGDGIIHIEAPGNSSNVDLNDFLTVWHDGFARLNFPVQLTQGTGWKIYINGQPFAGTVTSPLSTRVPLASRDIVTLEYGTPNPPPDTIYVFPADLSR